MFIPQQVSLPAGIHVFQRQKALVMNSGKPGYLQFMSIDNGKLIYNVKINNISLKYFKKNVLLFSWILLEKIMSHQMK